MQEKQKLLTAVLTPIQQWTVLKQPDERCLAGRKHTGPNSRTCMLEQNSQVKKNIVLVIISGVFPFIQNNHVEVSAQYKCYILILSTAKRKA